MNPETPRNPREELEMRITALLLGELSPEEVAALRTRMAADPELAALHARLEQAIGLLREAIAEPSAPPTPAQLSSERREALLAHFKTIHAPVAAPRRDWKWLVPMGVAAALVVVIGGALISVPAVKQSAASARYQRLAGKPAQVEWDRGTSQHTDADFVDINGDALAGEKIVAAVEAKADAPMPNYRFGNAPAPAAPAAEPVTTNGLASVSTDFGTRARLALPAQNAQTARNYALFDGGLNGAAALTPPPPATSDDFSAGSTSGGIAGATPKVASEERNAPGAFGANVAPASGPQAAATPAPSTEHWYFKRGLALDSAGVAPSEEKPGLFGDGEKMARNRTWAGGGAKSNGTVSEDAFWDIPSDRRTPKMGGATVAGGGLPGLAETSPENRFNEGELREQAAGIGLAAEAAGERTASGRTTNESLALNRTEWQSQPGAIRFDTSEAKLGKQLAGRAVEDAETLAKEHKSEVMLGLSAVDELEALRGEPALQPLVASKLKAPANPVPALATPAPVALADAPAGAPEMPVTRELARRTVSESRGRANPEAGQRTLAEKDTRTGKSQSESVSDLTPEDVNQLSLQLAPADGLVETRNKLAGLEEATKTSVDKFAKLEDRLVRQQVKEVAEVDTPEPKAKAVAPVPQPEILTSANAYSTFSLNVTDVSFKLAAASLEKGAMPEAAGVRSEEFINAFDYRDPEPVGNAPLSFAAERARYPFAQNRDVLRLAVKTAAAGRQPGRALNLVLLLDNSGSMERADRVRILREALRILAAQLQPTDKLSLITFARTPRLWADGVPGDKAAEATGRVVEITPEGGTNLAAALELGYATARRHYAAGSINRVVLVTDGAANLGDVNPAVLQRQVEAQRRQGIALDCFGVGWEGFNDDLLEQLSRHGDGRYGFINTPEEAASEFAGQLAGALRVSASDVKVQVEFNPRRVTAYRQIGYAKHQLTKEQFRDNTVDAAEIGAAESGNALYVVEVNPRGEGDLATVRVRFKVPGTAEYREHAWSVPFTQAALPLEQVSASLRLAATAGAFSEMLAGSPFAAEVTSDALLGLINGVPAAFGADPRPQRLEWMIRQAKSLSGR